MPLWKHQKNFGFLTFSGVIEMGRRRVKVKQSEIEFTT